MTTWHLLATAWDFPPSVVQGCVLLLVVHLASTRLRPVRATWLFAIGVALTFFALVSPLDELGDDYLFSAHMLQHILLDLLAPIFFVLGLPAPLLNRLMRFTLVAKVERVVGNPVVAWALGVGTLWLWHLPVLYDATLANQKLHAFEHLTFLVTGTIFWWPVFTPVEERRLAPAMGVVYLAPACIANAVLGIIFAFSSTPFYDGYAHIKDKLGALRLIRDGWGLNQITDQRLGGTFMWVIGGLIYLGAIMVLVARWYRQPEPELATPGAAKQGKTEHET